MTAEVGASRAGHPAPGQGGGTGLVIDAEYLHLSKNSAEATPMPLNIKDPATEKSVRELAALTGETVTTAVRGAAEERLLRVRRSQAGRSLAAEIMEIGKRCASLPDLDRRTADEILGYDDHGLPR